MFPKRTEHRLPLPQLTLLLLALCPAQCLEPLVGQIDHRDIIFQEVIEGEVEFENFTYYIVDSNEDIILNLTSLAGDCDLYISQARRSGENPPNPTIDTDSYDLQSTTCGEDVIAINREVIRPFTIGIYAHPSHHLCMFRLQITGIKSEASGFDFQNELNGGGSYETSDDVPNQDSFKQHHQQQQQRQQHKRGGTSKENDFDSFLELLLNIAIQFLGFIFEVIL